MRPWKKLLLTGIICTAVIIFEIVTSTVVMAIAVM